MSVIIKGMDMPKDLTSITVIMHGLEYDYSQRVYRDNIVEIPMPHGRLVEEHYPGELKAKQAEGIFILYRSADEDTDRFILEEEK